MIAVLLAGALLAAATPPAQDAKADKADKAVEDPMVCRSEMVVGSRLPVRVCMRKSEREALQRSSRKQLEDIQDRSRGPFKTNE